VVASAGVIVFLALVASASAAPPAPVTRTAPAEDARMTTRTPTLIWERSAGATRYEVHIDAGGLFAETAVVEDADCSATCSFTPLKGLSSNLYHSWKVVARNADGSTEASRRLIVDVPPTILTFHVAAPSSMHGLGPAVSVIHGPYCPRAGVTTDDPFVDNRYTLDGQPYNAESGFRWRLDCRLAAGRHTIAVNSIDQLGNSATASTTFVTDLVRPSVRIEGPARVAKGTTATFRAVVDPGTVVGPVAFSWSESWTPFGTGAELRLLANFDAADLAVSAQDAEGDEGSTLMHVETGPKPPSGKPGITAGRTSRTRRRATLRVVWPAGAKTVTLTEGRRTRTVPVARSIPWTFSGTGRRAVRARFDWPLPAKAYTARVTVHKRGSLNPRT
jgi:hypothetical protein